MGQSPIGTDRIAAALDVMEVLRGSISLLANLDSAQLRASIATLQTAKEEADAAAAKAASLYEAGQAAMEKASALSKSATEGEARAVAQLTQVQLREKDLAVHEAANARERASLDALATELRQREGTLAQGIAELDARNAAVDAANATIDKMRAELQRKLDAVKAAAGG
jgi:hypothetical protein